MPDDNWGVGASLAMEKIPVEKRGFFSGVLQQGYPVGYMFAAIAFFIVTPIAGWRGLFFVGALPALLSIFIRLRVGESVDTTDNNIGPQPPTIVTESRK
jgi:SHS family lactate transporter-like MFS transporter